MTWSLGSGVLQGLIVLCLPAQAAHADGSSTLPVSRDHVCSFELKKRPKGYKQRPEAQHFAFEMVASVPSHLDFAVEERVFVHFRLDGKASEKVAQFEAERALGSRPRPNIAILAAPGIFNVCSSGSTGTT